MARHREAEAEGREALRQRFRFRTGFDAAKRQPRAVSRRLQCFDFHTIGPFASASTGAPAALAGSPHDDFGSSFRTNCPQELFRGDHANQSRGVSRYNAADPGTSAKLLLNADVCSG